VNEGAGGSLCAPAIAIEGRLLGLAGKKKPQAGDDATIDQFVSSYRGILHVSRELLSLNSLRNAYEQGTPFSIEGDGSLFLQTQEALQRVEDALESQPEDLQAKIFDRLIQTLKPFSPAELETKEKKRRQQVDTTGSAPPFTLVYELPDAFKINGVAGQYTPDGKFLITMDSSGSVRTYSLEGHRRKVAYVTSPIASDGRGWDTREAALNLSPLVLRPGSGQFAFLLNGSSAAGPYLLDVTTGQLSNEFRNATSRGDGLPNTTYAQKLTFSRDGRHLGIGGKGSGNYSMPVAIWDIKENFVPVAHMQRFCGGISSGFSPDGRYYFNTAGSFHIHDVKDGYEILKLLPKGEEEWDSRNRCRGIATANELAVHPNKPIVALQAFRYDSLYTYLYDYSKLEKSYLQRFDELAGEPSQLGRRPVRYVRKPLQFSPFHAQKKKTWSDADGRGLLFSPDGNFLVSHGISREFDKPRQNQQTSAPDASLVVFRTHDLSQQGRIYKDLSAHISWRISKMRFSPDGSHFLTLDYWGRLTAFRLPDFAIIASVGGATAPIWDFEVSPDSRRVFTIEGKGRPRERNFLPE